MDKILIALPYILIFIGVIVFRNPLGYVLKNRNVRFKKGDAEFEISEDIGKKEVQKTIEETAATSPLKIEREREKEEDEKNYSLEVINAFIKRDMDLMEKRFEEMQNSETNINKKIENRAFYLHLLFSGGNTQALEQLEQLEQEHVESEVHKEILRFLAFCYRDSNKLDMAAKKSMQAAEKSHNNEEKARNLCYSAQCTYAMQEKEKAFEIINNAIAKENDPKALFIYYKELSLFFKSNNSTELSSFALEKALEYKPNDTETLFDLAYSYSLDNDSLYKDISLYYYKKLVDIDPKNSSAINNLGVIYENYRLPGLKVSAYKKSIDLENTLACANYSLALIEAGLFDEAYQTINKAYQILTTSKRPEEIHPNVGHAFAHIANRKEQENQKEKELLLNASVKQKFVKNFIDAYLKNLNGNFNGTWKFKNGNLLELKQNGNNLIATWSESSENYKIESQLQNRAGYLKLLSQKYDFSLKDYVYKDCGKGLLFFSEDSENLNMLLFNDSNSDKGEIMLLAKS